MPEVLTYAFWQLPDLLILVVLVLASVGLFFSRQTVAGSAMLAALAVQILRTAMGFAWAMALGLNWLDLGLMDLDTVKLVFLARSAVNSLTFTLQLALMLFAALYGRPIVRHE